MISHSTPSKIIKIDKHTNKIEYPTILLEKRNGSIIGKISDYTKYNLKLVASGVDEVSFNVHKYVNGKKCSVWDDLSDLKIIELKGYGRFQISVGYADNEQTIKTIFGQSLEVELGQITLENFHINDDEDMDMVKTEYSEHKYDSEGNFIPVTFYNKNNPKRSLLHMVLADKASHWNIGHVPNYVSMSEDAEAELASEFQRMYTEDSTSIYDFLTGTVAKETNVVFTFDTINRIINCYNLFECEINGVVVNSNDIIGEDTLIFATKRNIAKEINIESNEDQVKNCFRIEGGDDTITAMIAAINMNGTNYIFKVAPWQLADMSEELKNKLIEYQEEMSDQKIKDEYYGENGIYTRLCLAYEELYQKESTLMPNLTSVDPGTAEEQYNKIIDFVNGSDSYIYISKIKDWNSTYYAGITNDVEAYMTILTDSRYTVKIVDDSDSYDDKTHIWKGKIKVTQNTKDTNTYPIDIENSSYITVKIGDGSTVDGQIEFAKQKLYKSLASSDMQNLKFNLDDSDDVIKSYFNQFSLNRLKSFYDGYNGCLSIIQEYGSNTASDIQKELYDKYFRITSLLRTPSEEDKKKGILGVLDIREQEVESIKKEIKNIELEQSEFQSKHNFYTHLGEDLYKEFCAYRREDTYSNPNYISDNCNTVAEQLEKAKELMDVADTELSKACMLQRTVSASLSNLLVLPEFEKLYDSFALFNYIRIQTDDEVLKLRLIGIEFNGDSIQDINVIFSEQIESINRKISDIESVLNQTQSMITTYPSVVKQAKQGESANKQYIDIHDNGLNATMSMIRNNDNNEITITNSGFLAKRMDDEGFYGDKQLRIVGNGMYLTDDAWKSLKMAVGEIIYINPITGEEEKAYGIIADTIIGNLIAGKQMHIGNENGSVLITGDGIKISKGTIEWGDVNSPTIDDIPELPSELQSMDEQLDQLDGRIQTYSQTNDPSVDWATSTEKTSHSGDLWVNPQTGITKQWTGTSWIDVIDSYLKSLASSKAQIFTSKPTTEYFEGDMIIPVADFTFNEVTYIKNKVYRAYRNSNGKTFSNSDWDTLDYTNDDELTDFVTITYANNLESINSSISSINTQLDKKADTYYQNTVPTWIDGNSNHIGDMWYCTVDIGSYVSGKTYMFDGTTWREVENVPDSVFDMIDGKRQIFVSKPTSVAYRTGDLWIISESDCTNGNITVNGTTYESSSTLVAKLPNGVIERESFVASDWYDISTHDGIIALDKSTQALSLLDDIASDSKITPSEKQQLSLLWSNIKSEYNQIIKQCSQYSGIFTTNYSSYYSALATCVNNILSNMESTIDVPSNYSSSFSNYYTEKEKVIEEIEKASKAYANERLQSFIDGDYADDLDIVQEQIDGKAETWYQSNDPSNAWDTTELKELHVGDIWYDAVNKKSFIYSSSYSWEESDVPDGVYDMIDGKSTIYVSKPSSQEQGDLLIPNTTFTSTYNSVTYTFTTKKIYRCTTTNTTFNPSQWVEVDYTDTKYVGERLAQLEKDIEEYSDDNVEGLNKLVSEYLGLGGKTLESGDYVISPYIGGGYLNITSTDESGKRVIIDPNNLTKNNYIFQIHNGKEISVGIKADGTTNINAHIVAKSLDLITNNVKIPTNNVDGLDSKIKSYGYTTNDLAYKYLLDGKYFLVSGTKLSEITGYDEFANTLVLKSSISSTSKSETITLPSGETVSRTIYTTTVPNSDGTSQVFRTYDDGAYVFTNIGIGKGSSDPSTSSSTDTYVMIDKNGCLTADNAVIRGNIYAIDGYFSGSITASTISGSTFETTSGSGFTKITNGYVNVGKDDTIYGRLDYGTFRSLNGIGLVNVLPNGGYICLGHTKENKTIIDYWIDSSDFDNISHNFYGNINVNSNITVDGSINVDSIYMGNQKCLLSGLSTTESTGGIQCNGVFSTTGKLLVGNASLSKNSILDVNGSTYINNNLFVNGTTTLKGNISLASGWTVNSTRVYTTSAGQMGRGGSEGIFLVSGETGKDYIHVQDGVDDIFRVDYNGSVYSADGELSTSDRNKKHDIYTISEKYEKLFEELKPVTYIFNNKIRTHIGYIAQDVEESLKNNNIDTSEFAGYWREQKWKEKDDGNIEYLFDDEGNPIYDCGLRYSEFIALNTHMIQKTRNENKQLKQQIQNQKQEIDSLKESVSILMQQINQGQN